MMILILFLFTLPQGCVHGLGLGLADRRGSVSAGRCDHWCPEALVTHDPKTVCTMWGPPCLGCQECRCDAWCPEALANGQHDPRAVCTTWKQCTGCTECFDLRAAPKPKPCEAKPCKNAAVCVDNADGSFKCECTPGYEGAHCETDTDDCGDDACDHGGKCVDEVNGFSCECTEGFTGKNCEELEPAGMPHVHDPTSDASVEEAKLAVEALNSLRRKAKKKSSKIGIKRIVSYQTQLVKGMLHTFCIETNEAGYIQLVWDEDVSGQSHLSAVKPLHHSIKWFGEEPTETFVCTEMPIPYDPRPEGDRSPTEKTLLVETGATKKKSLLRQKTQEMLSSSSEFPAAWDARKDHKRSSQCAKIITHPQDQATCGSCYAYAATGTAAIRACMAGHDDIPEEGFSVQDAITCGKKWTGDFQNFNVNGMLPGSPFSNGCAGYQPHNVYEFATKHGLVADSCQPNAHGPDPLTGFDDDALSKQCRITNTQGSIVKPELDIWVPPSKSYVHFVDGLRDAVQNNNAVLTPAQKRELRRIVTVQSSDLAELDDAGILSTLRNPAKSGLVSLFLGKPKDKKTQMKLSAPIEGQATVVVDNDRWCDDSASNEWKASRSQDENGVCMGKMNMRIYMSRRKVITVKPHESSSFTKKLTVEGDKGALFGNVDKEFCEALTKELRYEQGSYRAKGLDVGDHQLIKFHMTGKASLGECHRSGHGEEFVAQNVKDKKKCRTHKMFSTPFKVYGKAQTEEVMKRAIMKLGAIDVTYRVPKSFSRWHGPDVYPGPNSNEVSAGPHASVLFGWGEENGKKFWWGKNSWGESWGLKGIFKYARGEDAGGIESLGAGWVDIDAPGEMHKGSVILPTSNAKGFCEDDLLDESLRSDKSKIDKACVKLTCRTSGDNICELVYTETCPKDKKTLVRVVSESDYRDVPGVAGKKQKFRVRSACIVNVRTEE